MADNTPSPRFDVKDALKFMDEVKKDFGASSQEYEAFIEILKGFREQTIGSNEVVTRVSALFHGHPSLIEGFNLFVPIGQVGGSPHRHTNQGAA
ncbi:paired amphipathic helix [Trametes maxima]|nr:paired amphipathic helix [Trametes maxima]